MEKRLISYKDMNVGEEFEAEFSIPGEKFEEYRKLFKREPFSHTPPYLVMLHAFRPLAEVCSIQPGTIHAAQSFTLVRPTEERNFRAKAVVHDKYEKRGRKYVVIRLDIQTLDGTAVAECSFSFVVPE